MSNWLRQSTAYTFRMGPFVDDVDGKTAETALTIGAAAIYLSKAGAALAAKNDATAATGTGTALGYYTIVLDATDTGTLAALRVHVHVAGALPVWRDFEVVNQNTYDSLVLGTLPVHANVQRLINSAQLATNLGRAAAAIAYGTTYSSGGTLTTFTTTDIVEATPDHYKGRTVTFTDGALKDESSVIEGYQLLSTPTRGQFTVAALTDPVPDTTAFVIN